MGDTMHITAILALAPLLLGYGAHAEATYVPDAVLQTQDAPPAVDPTDRLPDLYGSLSALLGKSSFYG